MKLMKHGQNVCLDEILNKFNTRLNVRKSCACSAAHIFDPILMKCGQNIGLDEISDECENRSC